MTEEDFQSFAQVFRNAGFRVDASCYEQRHFGSWWIDLSRESLPRQRVAWDGKDRWLIVQAFASDGL